MNHFDRLAHDCNNSIPSALELLQSCTRPSTYDHIAMSWCLTGVGNWLCSNGTTYLRTVAIIVLLHVHAWRRHQMESFSVLLALCVGNPPVTSGFPSQRPVTRRFDVFFDVRLNERLRKQSRCRWFEMSWRSLWHPWLPLYDGCCACLWLIFPYLPMFQFVLVNLDHSLLSIAFLHIVVKYVMLSRHPHID